MIHHSKKNHFFPGLDPIKSYFECGLFFANGLQAAMIYKFKLLMNVKKI